MNFDICEDKVSDGKMITVEEYMEELPNEVINTLRHFNTESEFAGYVELGKNYCILRMKYLFENGGTYDMEMLAPEVQFHSTNTNVGRDIWEKMPISRSDFFELIYVESGSIENYYGDGRRTIHAGEFCLLNRNTYYRTEYPQECSYILICFSYKYLKSVFDHCHLLLPNNLREHPDAFDYSILFEKSGKRVNYDKIALYFFPVKKEAQEKKADTMLRLICDEVRGLKAGYSLIVEGYFQRLFTTLTDKSEYGMEFNIRKSSNAENIFRELSLLMEKKDGIVTRGEIEKSISYNIDYVNRVIKKYSGMTLKEYSDYYKMKKVALLLEKTDLSICSIMEELQFGSSSAFYRLFAKQYKMSPTEYRLKTGRHGNTEI